MDEIVKRKLLLAKEFYKNGSRNADYEDAVSKMVAVHNLHIAVEITLRTIILEFEVRREKQLNIDFESMMGEIDNHGELKKQQKRLPYRQDMRNLNSFRNLIQHQAIEPDGTAMNDWRVLTSRFLKQAYADYFEIDFEELSKISFIENPVIRKHLVVAKKHFEFTNYESAAGYAASAFDLASHTIFDKLEGVSRPQETRFSFDEFGLSSKYAGSENEPLLKEIEKQHDRLMIVERFLAASAAGIEPNDYENFKLRAPHVAHTGDGRTHIGPWNKPGTLDERMCANWVIDFSTKAILRWQQLGYELKIWDRLGDPTSHLDDQIENMCVESLLRDNICQDTPPSNNKS
ncbi:hypothetical protein [Granulosicoccus antarcticus]|uniref:DUF3644 domain-containing protein n=1 Tax=Granulosicoccus antarcticus IMCC3135 TaxID=1192854 RepID=A0A2Z2P320_9GAMM|nr:hypothetical protein [Granulosicoccus antarcticus]ASJ76748.1 hypothetical protein IMCC3135_33520 [Granulosicoccus antarcticus IMCC3135]